MSPKKMEIIDLLKKGRMRKKNFEGEQGKKKMVLGPKLPYFGGVNQGERDRMIITKKAVMKEEKGDHVEGRGPGSDNSSGVSRKWPYRHRKKPGEKGKRGKNRKTNRKFGASPYGETVPARKPKRLKERSWRSPCKRKHWYCRGETVIKVPTLGKKKKLIRLKKRG